MGPIISVNTGEGSGYAIYKHPESVLYELFSWPMYGGNERYEGSFVSIEECIEETRSWT